MSPSQRGVVVTVVGAKQARPLRCDLLGDDQPGGGVGGWEETEGGKRGRGAGLAYRGAPAYTLSLPLGFNGISSGQAVSVEPQCRRLVDLGRATKKGGLPPRLHVQGLIRVPSNIDWVIDSIEWGTQIRNAAGARVQQQLTLNLVQYRKPKKSPAKDARKGKGEKSDG